MSTVQSNSISQVERSRPMDNEELSRPAGYSPISWEIVVPARRREQALEGVLVGGAVAEAVQYLVRMPRWFRSRRAVRSLLGSDAVLRMMPGHRMHAMIHTVQSLLLSRSSIDRFAHILKRRMSWYRASRPVSSVVAWLLGIVRWRVPRWQRSGLGTDPMARAALLSIVLQGLGNGALRWVQRSTSVTHGDARIAQTAALVAIAMQSAQVAGSEFEVPRKELLPRLADATTVPELRAMVSALARLLDEQGELESAAALLNLSDCASPKLVESALLGIYAWLRYEGDFRRAVEEIALVGRDMTTAAVVAGSLSGAEHGVDGLPAEWLARTNMEPYDDLWRESCVERLRDWPHGPEDIQRTMHLPVMPLGQWRRNLRFAWWRATLPLRRLVHRLTHIKGNRG